MMCLRIGNGFKMVSTRTVFFRFLVSLLAALIPAGVMAQGGPTGKGQPPVVTVMTVTQRDVNPPLEFVGRIEAVQAVDLRARVQGYLEEVCFAEGAYVKAGDVLYRIEQDYYQAQVDADKAKVAKAKATLTKAEQYLRRVKSVRSGGVSETDIEVAVADQKQAKAELEEAEASLAQSELNLSYTIVKAPISGRIGRTAFTRGNLVGPDSDPLAKIVQIDPIRVVFSISENMLPYIQEWRAAESPEKDEEASVFQLRLPNDALYPLTGREDFMDNEVDANTGTIAVRALFDNPEGSLVPGQFVTVLSSKSRAKRLPVVSQAAVQEDRQGRYVFVVDSENCVQQRRIKTGPVIETDWVVEEGLVVGETVVVSGVQKVRPGQAVKPIPAAKR